MCGNMSPMRYKIVVVLIACLLLGSCVGCSSLQKDNIKEISGEITSENINLGINKNLIGQNSDISEKEALNILMSTEWIESRWINSVIKRKSIVKSESDFIWKYISFSTKGNSKQVTLASMHDNYSFNFKISKLGESLFEVMETGTEGKDSIQIINVKIENPQKLLDKLVYKKIVCTYISFQPKENKKKEDKRIEYTSMPNTNNELLEERIAYMIFNENYVDDKGIKYSFSSHGEVNWGGKEFSSCSIELDPVGTGGGMDFLYLYNTQKEKDNSVGQGYFFEFKDEKLLIYSPRYMAGNGTYEKDALYLVLKKQTLSQSSMNGSHGNQEDDSYETPPTNADDTQSGFNRVMPLDLADGGTVYAGAASPEFENAENAFDNDLYTKWLIFKPSGFIQYQFKNDNQCAVTSYSISSANDYPERDPESWILEGSKDSSVWHMVDQRSMEDFNLRFQTKTYTITNHGEYKYYRFTFQNHSSDILQLSEIQLFGLQYALEKITASSESSHDGQGMEKAFDNNANTKWVAGDSKGWIAYNFNKPICVSNYSLTSARDYPERDPKDWELLGSNDNINWFRVDTKSSQHFSKRLQKKSYCASNRGTFIYYQLKVKNTTSGNPLQLGEIEFYEVEAGSDNAEGEGKNKAFDEDTQTKWLSFLNKDAITIKYMLPKVVTSYAITSANDYPDRDPKNWCLYGSNDSKSWVLLDIRKEEIFKSRFQRKVYLFRNTTSYLYYKLDITLNNGSNALQLAGIEYMQ